MSDETTDPLAPFAEAAARAEHAYLGTFTDPGARRTCPPVLHALPDHNPECPGYWIEDDWPSWEDDAEAVREGFRDDARRTLDAALAVDGPYRLIIGEFYGMTPRWPIEETLGLPRPSRRLFREVPR